MPSTVAGVVFCSQNLQAAQQRGRQVSGATEGQAQRGRHFDPALVDSFLAMVPELAPDLLQRTDARVRLGVGVLTLGQSTAAGATERIHSRNSVPPTRA